MHSQMWHSEYFSAPQDRNSCGSFTGIYGTVPTTSSFIFIISDNNSLYRSLPNCNQTLRNLAHFNATLLATMCHVHNRTRELQMVGITGIQQGMLGIEELLRISHGDVNNGTGFQWEWRNTIRYSHRNVSVIDCYGALQQQSYQLTEWLAANLTYFFIAV